MTTAPTCPSWCALGDECEGYHQSDPVAAPLPMTTGRDFGEALLVTVGHLEAEGDPPEIAISPHGKTRGLSDVGPVLRVDEVRTLIAALDDALFVLGEVTELTRLRQRVADMEAKAEEAKDAWMQACDDGGRFALQVEEFQGALEEERQRSARYAADLAALLMTIDLEVTVDESYAHVGRSVPAIRCPACVNDPSINDRATLCPGGDEVSP